MPLSLVGALLIWPFLLAAGGGAMAQEIDDDPAFANVAAVYWQEEVRLASDEDVDWYTFIMPHDGLLRLTQIDAGNAASYLTMALFDAEQNPVELPDARWRGNDLWRGVPLQAGRYLLSLRGRGWDQPYRLKLDMIDSPDTAEPNDRPEYAPQASGVYDTQKATADDQDWFEVTVEDPLLLDIRVDHGAEIESYYSARLVAPAIGLDREISLFWTKNSQGTDRQQALLNLTEGEYFIRLEANDPGFAVVPVTFIETPQPDAFEPNDTIDDAKPLMLAPQINEPILFQGDSDWFVFEATGAGTLTLSLQAPANTAYPPLALFAQDDPQTALTPAAQPSGSAYIYELEEGVYYARLDAYEQRQVRYRLLADFADASAATNDRGTKLYFLGLDAVGAVSEELKRIAKAGRGRVVDVPAEELELADTFAQVVTESKGGTYGFGHRLYTSISIIRERALRQPETEFSADGMAVMVNALIDENMAGEGISKPAFGPDFLPARLNSVQQETFTAAGGGSANRENLGRLFIRTILSPFEAE